MIRFRDVLSMSITMRTITRCEPPKGQRCRLESGSTLYDAHEARQHVKNHPDHRVFRETVSRTMYYAEQSAKE